MTLSGCESTDCSLSAASPGTTRALQGNFTLGRSVRLGNYHGIFHRRRGCSPTDEVRKCVLPRVPPCCWLLLYPWTSSANEGSYRTGLGNDCTVFKVNAECTESDQGSGETTIYTRAHVLTRTHTHTHTHTLHKYVSTALTALHLFPPRSNHKRGSRSDVYKTQECAHFGQQILPFSSNRITNRRFFPRQIKFLIFF